MNESMSRTKVSGLYPITSRKNQEAAQVRAAALRMAEEMKACGSACSILRVLSQFQAKVAKVQGR